MAKEIKIYESAMPISGEEIEHTILLIRGQKVMLDRDLARLYDVETKALNRAVKRNALPADEPGHVLTRFRVASPYTYCRHA